MRASPCSPAADCRKAFERMLVMIYRHSARGTEQAARMSRIMSSVLSARKFFNGSDHKLFSVAKVCTIIYDELERTGFAGNPYYPGVHVCSSSIHKCTSVCVTERDESRDTLTRRQVRDMHLLPEMEGLNLRLKDSKANQFLCILRAKSGEPTQSAPVSRLLQDQESTASSSRAPAARDHKSSDTTDASRFRRQLEEITGSGHGLIKENEQLKAQVKAQDAQISELILAQAVMKDQQANTQPSKEKVEELELNNEKLRSQIILEKNAALDEAQRREGALQLSSKRISILEKTRDELSNRFSKTQNYIEELESKVSSLERVKQFLEEGTKLSEELK